MCNNYCRLFGGSIHKHHLMLEMGSWSIDNWVEDLQWKRTLIVWDKDLRLRLENEIG